MIASDEMEVLSKTLEKAVYRAMQRCVGALQGLVFQQYFRPAQAAHFLGVSEAYLEALRIKGAGGPHFVRKGRMVLYRRQDLVEWAQADQDETHG